METERINYQKKVMHLPLISIIVPIYKAEDTLYRCLDSIKMQTFTDFEVLMVDDGSPDRCGKMIDEYASKDYRFKAFHKENGGVSSARQFGIDHASGEYTIHADPDDWVEPTMLEELYKKAKEDKADMVICDFFVNTYKGQHYLCQKPSSLNHDIVLKELFEHLHGSCCNKLVKLSCYKKWNIEFPLSLSRCEDQYVIASLLLRDIKIAYLHAAFYHYFRNNEHSLSRFFSAETHSQDILSRDLFYELLKNESIANEVYEQKTYTIIASAFWGGKDYYSSKAFKKEFASYEDIVQKKASSPIVKLLMVTACKGGYQGVISFISLYMRVKRFIFGGKLSIIFPFFEIVTIG